MYNFTVGYVQIFGCSLALNHTIVDVTEASEVSNFNNTNPQMIVHKYAEFLWEESSGERLANTFLTAFSPIPDPGDGNEWRDLGHTVVERILAQGLIDPTGWSSGSVRITEVEKWIERIFASWIWSIWQRCDFPYLLVDDSHDICRNFHSSKGILKLEDDPGDTPELVRAGVTRTLEKGRLHIFRWRSVTAFLSSVVLCMLSFLLLGTKSDLPKGASLREARLVEDVCLMVDSGVPSMVKKQGVSGIPLKYGVNEDESHWMLDVDTTKLQEL